MKKSLILVALLSLFLGFSSCEKDETPNVNPNPSQSTSDNDKEVKSLVVTFESAVLPECGYLREFGGEFEDIYAEDEDPEDEDAEPLYRQKNSFYAEQDLKFENYVYDYFYGPEYYMYSGFYVSSTTDKVIPDNTNDFSVYGDGGANGSKNYSVFYYGSGMTGDITSIVDKDAKPFTPKSVYLALTTYCYQSAYNAQNDITKFSSEAKDFFELEIVGLDKDGKEVASQKIKIIDGENSDFIGWKKVEFDESFANISKITFKTLSSQKNDWGDIFPSYIALDDFEFVR